MIDLGYVKQGTKSKFIFINYYETIRAPLGISIEKYFHSRPLKISIFHTIYAKAICSSAK
jgi:hypothetical protein